MCYCLAVLVMLAPPETFDGGVVGLWEREMICYNW